MSCNPDIHHRRYIRLREFDYRSAGAYFVTICAFQRECLFGEVVDGEMRLNGLGLTAEACWRAITNHFPNLQLDEFMIMPNHFHAILNIATSESIGSNVGAAGEGKTRGKCSELRISASTNQALVALQTDPSIRRYLRLFLDYNYEETRKVASGGVQPNLNLSLVRSIRIPLPPHYEQPQIVAEIDRRLSVTEKIETTIVTNLKRAERLRQTVPQQAFSGGMMS